MFALRNIINTIDILSKGSLENIVQEYITILNYTQYEFSKNVNITKYLKVCWNKEYNIKLNTYCLFKLLEDQKKFKEFVKQTQYSFFDEKIQEIILKTRGSRIL